MLRAMIYISITDNFLPSVWQENMIDDPWPRFILPRSECKKNKSGTSEILEHFLENDEQLKHKSVVNVFELGVIRIFVSGKMRQI